MDIINAKIPMILASIEKMSTKDLESYEIVSVITIKKELRNISEIVAESQEKILSSYGLKSENGSYSWNHHEKASEITAKIQSLLEKTSKIISIPSIGEDSFYASVKGMSFSEIEELSKLLLI